MHFDTLTVRALWLELICTKVAVVGVSDCLPHKKSWLEISKNPTNLDTRNKHVKLQNPHAGLGREEYRNIAENDHFRSFSVFLSYFGCPTRVGGFCFFFCFSRFEGFWNFVQQFTYEVVWEGIIADNFLQNFHGISALFPGATNRTFANILKFPTEFPQVFRKNPFANDPISELLADLCRLTEISNPSTTDSLCSSLTAARSVSCAPDTGLLLRLFIGGGGDSNVGEDGDPETCVHVIVSTMFCLQANLEGSKRGQSTTNSTQHFIRNTFASLKVLRGTFAWLDPQGPRLQKTCT